MVSVFSLARINDEILFEFDKLIAYALEVTTDVELKAGAHRRFGVAALANLFMAQLVRP